MNEEILEEALTETGDVAEEMTEEAGESPMPTDEPLPDFDEELKEMREQMPELYGCNEERYSALRGIGLTAEEAYRATTVTVRSSGRAHLSDSTPIRAHSPYGGMSRQTLESARALFDDMSDAELQGLYRRVTK